MNNNLSIETRAEIYAKSKGDISLSKIYNQCLANIYKEAYIAGAKEQKEIDKKNACLRFCFQNLYCEVDDIEKCQQEEGGCREWRRFKKGAFEEDYFAMENNIELID